MNTYVLYNHLADNGNGEAEAKCLQSVWKDRELSYKDITKIENYKEFIAGLKEDDEIVICGGDGTLNRFANNIDGISVPNKIYMYAAGTGNDFLNDLEVKADAEPVQINKYLEYLPTVEVKGKKYKFINAIGYGIDGYCCEVADKMKAESDKPINYSSIAIKGMLYAYKPVSGTVTVDGKTTKYKKLWLAPTMNGRFYGGGMMAAPDQCRLNADHTVTCMAFHSSGRIKSLLIFSNIFKGEHIKYEDTVTMYVGHEINVKFDRPVALQIDGETVLGVEEYTVYSK